MSDPLYKNMKMSDPMYESDEIKIPSLYEELDSSTQAEHANVTWTTSGMDMEIDYGKILSEKDGSGVDMCPHFDGCEDNCMLYQVKTYILNNNELKTEDFTKMQSNWWNHMSADGIRVEPPGLCKSCQQCSCGIDRKSNIEELERHILKSLSLIHI